MTKIGIYDSGVGGLTALKKLLDGGVRGKFVYLADNKRHPFGAMDEASLLSAIKYGVSYLEKRCDVVVVACNTASSVIEGDEVCKLTPPHAIFKSGTSCADLPIRQKKPLLLATAGTAGRIINRDDFYIADTAELATLIEEELQKNFDKKVAVRNKNERGGKQINLLDMSTLKGYVYDKLKNFKGVDGVVLGCSHYPYVINEIREVLGDVEFSDGCAALVENAKIRLEKMRRNKAQNSDDLCEFEFVFTGKDEGEKYVEVLNALLKNKLGY